MSGDDMTSINDATSSVPSYLRMRPFNARETSISTRMLYCMGPSLELCSGRRSFNKEGGQDDVVSVLEYAQCPRGFQQKIVGEQFTCGEFLTCLPKDGERYANQEYVYERVGRPALNDFLKGFNTCVFAYGQTGSGKTHTIFGAPAPEQGLLPRFMNELLDHHLFPWEQHQRLMAIALHLCVWDAPVMDRVIPPIAVACHSMTSEERAKQQRPTVQLSFLELYSEKVRDVLDKKQRRGEFMEPRMRHHPVKGRYVDGVVSKDVTSGLEALSLLKFAMVERSMCQVKMGGYNSRSHAVVLVRVISHDERRYWREKVAIVADLAGAERIKLLSPCQAELKINHSLTTLGRVIDSLTTETRAASPKSQPQCSPPPYRDSILTFLLTEALGGDCRTRMIATVSPHVANLDTTLVTLRFMSKMRCIQCNAQVNLIDWPRDNYHNYFCDERAQLARNAKLRARFSEAWQIAFGASSGSRKAQRPPQQSESKKEDTPEGQFVQNPLMLEELSSLEAERQQLQEDVNELSSIVSMRLLDLEQLSDSNGKAARAIARMERRAESLEKEVESLKRQLVFLASASAVAVVDDEDVRTFKSYEWREVFAQRQQTIPDAVKELYEAAAAATESTHDAWPTRHSSSTNASVPRLSGCCVRQSNNNDHNANRFTTSYEMSSANRPRFQQHRSFVSTVLASQLPTAAANMSTTNIGFFERGRFIDHHPVDRKLILRLRDGNVSSARKR